MRISLAQLNYHIGNFDENFKSITKAIETAKIQNADLIIFSELATIGYPPQDLLYHDSFIKKNEALLRKIEALADGITIIIGSIKVNTDKKGKKLFNAAFTFQNKKCIHTAEKQLLPNYDIFDESRYFESGANNDVITVGKFKIAVSVCEDLWDVDDEELYKSGPMSKLILQKPDIIVNIAASPFSYTHQEKRAEILRRNAEKFDLPVIYVNQVGAHSELIFDGSSLLMNNKGDVIERLSFCKEQLFTFDSDILFQKTSKSIPKPDVAEQLHDSLVFGIKDFFEKQAFKKAILGLSGGIDSALVLVLAVKALGKENVLPVLLPSEFSSQHSIDDSLALCENLGVESHTISIKDLYSLVNQTLYPIFGETDFGVTEENLQSRLRGLILMAISNKKGYILLNTTNKSEAAVGYGTLYGDLNGGLSVIGDLYKKHVYAISLYINRESEIIPENIITKEPSAELKPDQKDTDFLPDYDILDNILESYIEKYMSAEAIISTFNYSPETVNKVFSLVNRNEFKRYQMAPVLRVTSKGFGIGRRYPLVAKY
ncbi:MAG: NAD+ synthase [Chitinophagaceae bacterium]|nr:MAG: NAD+ synthase [Chitinophagaceae bacterium]